MMSESPHRPRRQISLPPSTPLPLVSGPMPLASTHLPSTPLSPSLVPSLKRKEPLALPESPGIVLLDGGYYSPYAGSSSYIAASPTSPKSPILFAAGPTSPISSSSPMLLLGLSKAPMAIARRRKAATRASGSMREVAVGDGLEGEHAQREDREEDSEEPLPDLAVEDIDADNPSYGYNSSPLLGGRAGVLVPPASTDSSAAPSPSPSFLLPNWKDDGDEPVDVQMQGLSVTDGTEDDPRPSLPSAYQTPIRYPSQSPAFCALPHSPPLGHIHFGSPVRKGSEMESTLRKKRRLLDHVREETDTALQLNGVPPTEPALREEL